MLRLVAPLAVQRKVAVWPGKMAEGDAVKDWIVGAVAV
jgi:hypothetical protein